MKFTWLGHSGFRIEIGDQILLLDPWLTGNPMFPEDRRAEAIAGATHVLLTHGHFDHANDVADIAKELGIPVVGIFDLVGHLEATAGVTSVGFNKGGTVALGSVKVTMVNAVHSSTMPSQNGPLAVGSEAGFVLDDGSRRVYVSGDTDVTMDMELVEALHQPEIGLLCAGGHFTMDMKRAAYAAKRFFNFKTVIPCHYRTFPLLAQSADELKAGLPGVDVIEPEVMTAIEL
ncbi:metal-dependent hydrolase [Poseidonocella sp. HB161398]|uniref:metal-dependent hydrolase n=1 Tax=Poseidonocella sp. HB161398 TaxID=2320855 RepID=UPI0011096145|nr:metal-dependent hydrolase [Poseidonocella sp. HB161398]